MPDTTLFDLHAHIMFAELAEAAGAAGPFYESGPNGSRVRVCDYVIEGDLQATPFMNIDLRLKAMDAASIERQMLSPSPLTYFHFIDGVTAQEYCRRHNVILADTVSQHSDRFLGAASLPMQRLDLAAVELEFAVRELDLKAAYIGTEFGMNLDDPGLDVFYETLTNLDVPLFLHPAPHGVDGPPVDPRFERFDLDHSLGYAPEETLAVSTLIYGGVLERHPELDVCVSHGGGAAPYLYGRLSHAAASRAWASETLASDGGFDSQFRRLWFDCHVHSELALECLLSVADHHHIVYGTNFAGWDQGGSLDVGALRETLTANAVRLLRL